METLRVAQVDPAVMDLISRSVSVRKNSHSPYSKFPVGAALLCKDGTIFTGVNVENVSFSLTVCAERTAVLKAVSEGYKEFEAIAVCAVNEEMLVSPCGACRQTLVEFNPRIKIYLHNCATEYVGLTSLEHLLPVSFNPENAKICV